MLSKLLSQFSFLLGLVQNPEVSEPPVVGHSTTGDDTGTGAGTPTPLKIYGIEICQPILNPFKNTSTEVLIK